MKSALVWLTTFAGVCVLALGVSFVPGAGQTQNRIFFQISTGTTGGTYFPIGEMLAGIISHPAGISRCQVAGVCGPPGLIASTRTSEGAVANVFAVNSGAVDSGLAQADVVADAVAGRGVFARTGAQKHLRVIAALFPEDLHLFAGVKSKITDIGDLKGKRVELGAANSGTLVTAREVLAAFHISERSIKASFDTSDVAARKLMNGEVDAMFFIGGAPVPLASELLSTGVVKLMPISGKGIGQLAKSKIALTPSTIPAGSYPHTSPIDTVSTRALWIVNDSEPSDIVFGILQALFNPVNRGLLNQGKSSARLIHVDAAAVNLPAPLHPGAELYYRKVGKLSAAPAPATHPKPKPHP